MARTRRSVTAGDPVVSWSVSLGVTVLALVMRLWRLGSPHAILFDETYYAKDAWSLLQLGYTREYSNRANDLILQGNFSGFGQNPSMEVHPELGKWLIAIGEKIFGLTPFGWRFSAAVVGSLMVLVLIRLALRLTGSLALAAAAGILLTFDGLEFVLSRLALLDIFLSFFLLLAVHCVVADRQWHHRRLAEKSAELADGSVGGWGPVRTALFRPWLLAAGVSFGLAAGCKWTAIYPLAAFGVMVVVWSAGARRKIGVRFPLAKAVVADGVPAFVHLILVGVIVYVATWTAWLMHADVYEEHFNSTQYALYNHGKPWPTASEPDAHGFGELTQSMRSLWHYHHDLYVFHTHFLNDATHTYQSLPQGWLLLNRPVGVDAQNGIKPGERGCTAPKGSDCLKQVLLLGTPALWWGGCLALLGALATWVGARDWRFGLTIVGVASTWLPWLQYDDRPIFLFYALPCLPFMILASVLLMGRAIGSGTELTSRRTIGVVGSGVFVLLVVVNFIWFYPIFSDQLITHSQWLERIWFKRWI